MTLTPENLQSINNRVQQRRASLVAMRNRVRERRSAGEGGIVCCQWLSDQVDELIREIVRQQQFAQPGVLPASFAVLAIGGNGRRRPAPYSDIDLLFLVDGKQRTTVQEFLSAIVRDCWDAGAQLGSSIRTVSDVVRFANDDIQFATSIIETRFLCGNEQLAETAVQQVRSRVFLNRSEPMILRLVASRREEWMTRGNSVNQLEPDLKRSPGGLRDLHLLRWVSFMRYRNPDPLQLQQKGDISTQELEDLLLADEFLSSLRTDLHSLTGLKQDVMTRELQLQLSEQRGFGSSNLLRPVEAFMQEYFGHTSRVAAVARRVAEVPSRSSIFSRLRNAILPQKSAQGFLIIDGMVEVPEARRESLRDPLTILDVFVSAAENQAKLSPELRKTIGQFALSLPEEPGRETIDRFRDILRFADGLPDTLRAMYETGILEWLIPPFAAIRNLMQFNQYHSFTVDEHTLKAMDEMTS